MRLFISGFVVIYLMKFFVFVVLFLRKFYILFVLVDDFGWSDVSFYGFKIKILNVDKLVVEGVILD